jgi:hypothetical protein
LGRSNAINLVAAVCAPADLYKPVSATLTKTNLEDLFVSVTFIDVGMKNQIHASSKGRRD